MPKDMAEILRSAIRKSGLALAEIARRSGVPQPRITVFLHGRDIRLATAQKLADCLGLEFVNKAKQK